VVSLEYYQFEFVRKINPNHYVQSHLFTVKDSGSQYSLRHPGTSRK
jgi:hypothetical protein